MDNNPYIEGMDCEDCNETISPEEWADSVQDDSGLYHEECRDRLIKESHRRATGFDL